MLIELISAVCVQHSSDARLTVLPRVKRILPYYYGDLSRSELRPWRDAMTMAYTILSASNNVNGLSKKSEKKRFRAKQTGEEADRQTGARRGRTTNTEL